MISPLAHAIPVDRKHNVLGQQERCRITAPFTVPFTDPFVSMLKKTILFSIELADRELLAKTWLAMEMVKRGFRVYIGTFRALHEIRHKIDSCIFFHKSSYKRRALQYKRQMGAVIAVLDEEAGIAIPSRNLDEFCQFRYGPINKEAYDYVFTIGHGYTQRLLAMPNMAGVKVVTTGWPRIDLWREEYAAIHADKMAEIRQAHGDYWLFVSSFGFTSRAGMECQLKNAQADKSSYSEKWALSLQNVYQALTNYIDLLGQLAADARQKIIIRPHTSESIDEWKALFAAYPNVEVIREGDIAPWLLAASGVITYRSTVNVQAALNGIPTVQYKINEIDGVDDLAVFKVSKCAETVDEVKQYLDSFKSADERHRLKEAAVALLKDDVSSLNGPTAVSRIADTLAQVEVRPQPEIRVHALMKTLSHGWNRYKYAEYRLHKVLHQTIFRNRARRMSRFDKVPRGIQAEEIAAIAKLMQSVQQDETTAIPCRQVSTNLVEMG